MSLESNVGLDLSSVNGGMGKKESWCGRGGRGEKTGARRKWHRWYESSLPSRSHGY